LNTKEVNKVNEENLGCNDCKNENVVYDHGTGEKNL